MKLIFVYNADSGFVNTLMDIGHKIIRPDTYTCNLCKLTFDNFRESSAWKAFREEENFHMTFLHRDEFEDRYKKNYIYPVILIEKDGTLTTALSANELNKISSIEELIQRVGELKSDKREV